jgi:serine/threonine protein kinase
MRVKVPVAVKTLNKQHLVSGKEGFMREATVMVQLDHQCIVKLIGICEGAELMLVSDTFMILNQLSIRFNRNCVIADIDKPQRIVESVVRCTH